MERADQRYVETRRPSLAAHRPGEPWLRKRVLLLARLLRARSESWKGAERGIHDLFALARHGDVAIAEKIRRYVREEWKRDPPFGDSPTGLEAWFVESSGRPRGMAFGPTRRRPARIRKR